MRITFDPSKRDATLRDRGLDFVDAEFILAGPTLRVVDRRRDYGEEGIINYGLLRGPPSGGRLGRTERRTAHRFHEEGQ